MDSRDDVYCNSLIGIVDTSQNKKKKKTEQNLKTKTKVQDKGKRDFSYI